MRLLMVQGGFFVFVPVLAAWGLFGINTFYMVKKKSQFLYTWQKMKVKRYFMVIVPDRVSLWSYIAFKLTLNFIYAITMTWCYNRGVRASWAWYKVAANRADRDPY